MSSLKKTLMQQGMKLMADPRVMKLMQDERFMKARPARGRRQDDVAGHRG
jgi:hypothetical protein